jgi:antitoxin component YwqK of YwqJK toxin-antitoxin module
LLGCVAVRLRFLCLRLATGMYLHDVKDQEVIHHKHFNNCNNPFIFMFIQKISKLIMKHFFLPAILLIISITATSQAKQFRYYFNKDLDASTKEKAVFTGVGSYVNDLFEFKLYNVQTNDLLAIQHFKDSLLQQSEGSFKSFYADGNLESEGNYLKGNKDGLWQKWDSASHVIDSSIYEDGTLTRYTHRGYNKSGYPDSVVINDTKKNELVKRFYKDSGRIANEVYFTGNGGLEKFYDEKGVYKSSDSVFSRDEIEAAFPGGERAWMTYIVSGLQRHADDLIKAGVYGSCIIKFIVGKDGKVKDVEATTMKGTALAEAGMRIIRNSPKWNPASQYGRIVNAYRLQPVTLANPN